MPLFGLFCSGIMVTKNPLNQAFFLREVVALGEVHLDSMNIHHTSPLQNKGPVS